MYRVLSRREVLKNKGLTSDQTIEFTGLQTAKKCPVQLRRIGYRDPESGKHYVFLTNNFKLAAKTIADIYKARWQVDIFQPYCLHKFQLIVFSLLFLHGNDKSTALAVPYIQATA